MTVKRKKLNFKLHQLLVVAMTIVLVGIMVVNVLLMYDIAAEQTEEVGRMRVQNIATGFQKSLTRAEYTLERVSSSLEEMNDPEWGLRGRNPAFPCGTERC